MGEANSSGGENKKCIQHFVWKNQRVTATFRRMRKVWRIICIKGNVRKIRGHFKEGSVFFKVVYLFPHHSDASCVYYFFSTIWEQPCKEWTRQNTSNQQKIWCCYSVASLPVDAFEEYNYIAFPVPVTKVHYLCYRVNKQHLYQKFINDRFVCY